jgi:SAM-dependent methyltransferase
MDFVPEGQTVLNIGCAGVPHLHALLKERSKVLVGIDIDEQGLGVLRDQGWDVRCMNAEAISLPPIFDCVVAGELIEHLSNPGKFLSSATSCIRPGGRFILTTPNISSILLYFLVVLCEKPQDRTHVYHFDRPNLLTLLSRYPNLEIEKVLYVPATIKGYGTGMTRPLFYLATALADLGFRVSKRLFGSYLIVVLKKHKEMDDKPDGT